MARWVLRGVPPVCRCLGLVLCASLAQSATEGQPLGHLAGANKGRSPGHHAGRGHHADRGQHSGRGLYWGDRVAGLVANASRNSAQGERSSREMLQRFSGRGGFPLLATSDPSSGGFRPPSVDKVLGLDPTEGNSPSWHRNSGYKAQRAEGSKSQPAGTGFNSKYQKIMTAVDFAWWCNNTWQCWLNPDNSITLSTFWDATVSGWHSRMNFFYGVFSVEMKLPKVNSDGVWHTFYLIQPQNWPNNDQRHAEIDIKFYGAKDPKKIVLATNIISNGYQNLEQHKLPFDPSQAYHRYTIVWSPTEIIWFIDKVPIRLTRRTKGSPWPARPVQLLGTTWATRSKIDWREGPMSVQYRNLDFYACTTYAEGSPMPACAKQVANKRLPWNRKLTTAQIRLLNQFRRNYLLNAWGWDKWK